MTTRPATPGPTAAHRPLRRRVVLPALAAACWLLAAAPAQAQYGQQAMQPAASTPTEAPAAHRAATAQAGWRPCANEGGICRFDGEALVRYGAEGRYAFRLARNRVFCDNEAFGDPAPDRPKRCEVLPDWRQHDSYRHWRDGGAGAAPAGWRLCAFEGGDCLVDRPSLVRYGAAGRYVTREASRPLRCTNEVFGDPQPGIAKQCEVAVAGATAPPAATGPAVPVVPGAGVAALPWDDCAAEGSRCSLRGPGLVRYGIPGRYLYREAPDDIVCGNAEFGGDPAPNHPKRCQRLRLRR